jgi:hypothetical protein
MIALKQSLAKEMISYLQENDPVVKEYRAFFRSV